MRSVKIKIIIVLLLALQILLTGYLAYADSVGSTEGVCLIESNDFQSCSDVQNSVYGEIFGMKLYYFGLAAFSILIVIFIYSQIHNRHERIAFKIFVLLNFVGAPFAIYFLFIQFFILKTLCSTCMVIDFSAIISAALAWIEYRGRWRNAPLV